MNVILPKSGMGIDEGTILRWLRKEGERVEKGEPIVEIETAKTTQELEAPATGILVTVLVSEGATAAVNTVIAIIDESQVHPA